MMAAFRVNSACGMTASAVCACWDVPPAAESRRRRLGSILSAALSVRIYCYQQLHHPCMALGGDLTDLDIGILPARLLHPTCRLSAPPRTVFSCRYQNTLAVSRDTITVFEQICLKIVLVLRPFPTGGVAAFLRPYTFVTAPDISVYYE